MTFPMFRFQSLDDTPLQNSENMYYTAMLNYHRLGVWLRMRDMQTLVRIDWKMDAWVRLVRRRIVPPTLPQKFSRNSVGLVKMRYPLVIKHHHDDNFISWDKSL